MKYKRNVDELIENYKKQGVVFEEFNVGIPLESEFFELLRSNDWGKIFNLKIDNVSLYEKYIIKKEDYRNFMQTIMKSYGTSVLEKVKKTNLKNRASTKYLMFVEQVIKERLYYKWGVK